MTRRKGRPGTAKPIRVGVVGIRRGLSFAGPAAEAVGLKVVALCDVWEQRLKEAGKRLGIATYIDFDKFLEHDLDAVVVANYFHQHAPLAIRALESGRHVLSETSACKTLGEGVVLARAVEKSGRIYMLAENYCFFAYNQEMRRLYRQNEIGDVQFAECEYNHPFNARDFSALAPGVNHWRNWMPTTYYCTHALGPIIYITDTRPVYVNAHSLAFSPKDPERAPVRRGDAGSSVLIRMDNGATVHLLGLMLRGISIWYRLHGTRGLMENLRTHGEEAKLRIVHEAWDRKPDEPAERIYTPEFPVCADWARRTGHGGGDFFTNYFFAEAIRKKEQPFLNVYRALDMTLAGIQAWKSCLDKGHPYDIPDFRKESVRKQYENEVWSPFPEDANKAPNQPPPSILGPNPPDQKQLAAARLCWRDLGISDATLSKIRTR